jgi:histidinol-phosphate aminotransferase
VESLQAYSAPLEGRRGLLRLDFNENTVGPSPQVVAAIRAIPADHYAIYPEYDGLREALITNLADRSGGRPGLVAPLQPAQVGLFNGVDAAIHAIVHAYGDRGDTLLTTSPTFGYYTPCAQMQGMAIAAIPYNLPDFAFPLEAIHQALVPPAGASRPASCCSAIPTTPPAPAWPRSRSWPWQRRLPRPWWWWMKLYEAFTGDSVLPLADFEATPNLLVLRSSPKPLAWRACAWASRSAMGRSSIASAASPAPTTSTALP